MEKQNKEPEQGADYASWYPEGYAFNLSDFALFLSVMKNKRAYECTLSVNAVFILYVFAVQKM